MDAAYIAPELGNALVKRHMNCVIELFFRSLPLPQVAIGSASGSFWPTAPRIVEHLEVGKDDLNCTNYQQGLASAGDYRETSSGPSGGADQDCCGNK